MPPAVPTEMTTKVRAYVVARLKEQIGSPLDYPTNAGARVYNGKYAPGMKQEFPYIDVLTPVEENEEIICENPLEIKKKITLQIEACTRDTDTPNTALDVLKAQINARVDMALNLDATGITDDNKPNVTSCIWQRAEIQGMTVADYNYMSMFNTYDVTYTWRQELPESEGSPLELLHTDYNMADPTDGTTEDEPDELIDAETDTDVSE